MLTVPSNNAVCFGGTAQKYIMRHSYRRTCFISARIIFGNSLYELYVWIVRKEKYTSSTEIQIHRDVELIIINLYWYIWIVYSISLYQLPIANQSCDVDTPEINYEQIRSRRAHINEGNFVIWQDKYIDRDTDTRTPGTVRYRHLPFLLAVVVDPVAGTVLPEGVWGPPWGRPAVIYPTIGSPLVHQLYTVHGDEILKRKRKRKLYQHCRI